MTDKDIEYIRVAAYYLWENEGRPEGRAEEFWIRACKQFPAKKAAAKKVAAKKAAPKKVEAKKAEAKKAPAKKVEAKKAAPKKGKGKNAKPASEPVEITTVPDLVLPNRLMYRIEDSAGRQQVVFADEIILIERSKLFAGSANALERYRKRMVQILGLLGEIEKSTDGLYSRIHTISVEEPL